MSTSTPQRPLAQRRTAAPRSAPAPRGHRRAWGARGHLVAAGLLTLAFVSPVYLTLVNAFKTQAQIVRDPAAPPLPRPRTT